MGGQAEGQEGQQEGRKNEGSFHGIPFLLKAEFTLLTANCLTDEAFINCLSCLFRYI